MATKLLSRQQAIAALGMPARSFARWASRGMPRHGDKFPWPEIQIWYGDQRETRGRESVKPADIDEAKKRLVTAEAELKEAELATLRGETMTVDEALALVGEEHMRMVGALNSLEPRLAALGLARKQVRAALDDVRRDLAKADDIPEDDDSDD